MSQFVVLIPGCKSSQYRMWWWLDGLQRKMGSPNLSNKSYLTSLYDCSIQKPAMPIARQWREERPAMAKSKQKVSVKVNTSQGIVLIRVGLGVDRHWASQATQAAGCSVLAPNPNAPFHLHQCDSEDEWELTGIPFSGRWGSGPHVGLHFS